ncbi:baseplate J/gp47 family protein [Oligella urethralis]|uniref:baseplate J/gp47 family protein n=1 Tax=Oligella urethralis TaxID=90245 RepID=UPI00288B9C6E|nr:baseplate J/gp47 family protein [Oligella urethralis]
MAELTARGFKRKTQNEYFEEERDLYLDIDPEWTLDPSSPDGLKLAHDAEVFSALDEVLYKAWASKDPNSATHVDLDIVSGITGTLRKDGTPSNVDLTFQGLPGSVILEGSLVESTETGQRWRVNQTFYIAPSGYVVATAQNVEIGANEAEPNTITKMVTVIEGVVSVTNESPATPGTSKESDASLRIRRRLEVGKNSSNMVDSIYGALSGLAGVRRVEVYENDTKSAAYDPDHNPHSLPENSITILVDGGQVDDIAKAIYLKKNPGVMLNGDGTVVQEWVTSPTRSTHQQLITFGRPNYVDIQVAIEVANDGTLPDGYEELIKESIISYSAGESPSGIEGFKTTGFRIGESVPISMIYTPINQVIGRYGASYVTSLTLDGASTNKAIAYNELSRWLESNITVTES